MWAKVLRQTEDFSVIQFVGHPAVLKTKISNLPQPGYIVDLQNVQYDFATFYATQSLNEPDILSPLPKRPKLDS